MKNVKHYGKRLLAMVLSLVMCFGLLQTVALAAGTPPAGWTTRKPSGSSVSAYGTCIDGAETQVIISGPLYGSKWYNQVSSTANTNNYSYRIPQVSELFTIADGYELAYVSVAETAAATASRAPVSCSAAAAALWCTTSSGPPRFLSRIH